MKIDKSFYFLRPRLLNIFLTILVLCLPLLREQYNQGQYVTWHRPNFLLARYLQMNDYDPFFLMVGFSLVVYIAVSAILAIILRLLKKGE